MEITSYLLGKKAGGGSGGTSNYNELSNKPSINGVTLSGDKTSEDLGIKSGGGNVYFDDTQYTSANPFIFLGKKKGIYFFNQNIDEFYVKFSEASSSVMSLFNISNKTTGGVFLNMIQIYEDVTEEMADRTYLCAFIACTNNGNSDDYPFIRITIRKRNDTASGVAIGSNSGYGSYSNIETKANRVKTITSSSNDYKYPTAKAVWTLPTTYSGYDATKTQVLKNINGTLTWVDE